MLQWHDCWRCTKRCRASASVFDASRLVTEPLSPALVCDGNSLNQTATSAKSSHIKMCCNGALYFLRPMAEGTNLCSVDSVKWICSKWIEMEFEFWCSHPSPTWPESIYILGVQQRGGSNTNNQHVGRKRIGSWLYGIVLVLPHAGWSRRSDINLGGPGDM